MSIEKIRIESRPELEEMVNKELGQVDADLTMICSNVPINDKATLDVLCHDNNGQLVILQLSLCEDDVMLLHGIQSLDYVDKFKFFLKATYNKHKIDDNVRPRLVLVAPSFSDAVRHAVESMRGLHIDLYEWEYLRIGDHKGFHLQPVSTSKPTERPREKEERPAEKKHGKKKESESLPAPEMKEEAEPAPLESSAEPPREEFPAESQQPSETKEEPPKRKLRLF